MSFTSNVDDNMKICGDFVMTEESSAKRSKNCQPSSIGIKMSRKSTSGNSAGAAELPDVIINGGLAIFKFRSTGFVCAASDLFSNNHAADIVIVDNAYVSFTHRPN